MKRKLLSILLAFCLLLACVPVLTPAAAAAPLEPVGLECSLPYGDTISAGIRITAWASERRGMR